MAGAPMGDRAGVSFSTRSPVRRPSSLKVQAILCVLCTLVGAFYPTMVDWSKTAVERWAVSTAGGIEWQEARAFPFSPVSVVLVDDFVQFSIALCFLRSKFRLRELFGDRSLVLTMMPLGAIYALGEYLTFRSVQKSSGPVYVVISNMKLVVAAVMSRAVFGRSEARPWLHWLQLVLISLAAAGFTILEAGSMGSQWRWEGAFMALAKGVLVAFSSVFCEHTYKNNPFYITLTLQAFWGLVSAALLASVALSGLAAPGISEELRDSDGLVSIFSSGSQHPLCDSAEHGECLASLAALRTLPAVGATHCHCLSARGWDMFTAFTVVADLSNAVSSALVFRQLSAVAKYVCRATSAVPMYVFYCLVGRSAWRLRTFAVIVYLSVQVSVYTLQRHRAAAAAAKAAEAAPPDAVWVKDYGGPPPHGGKLRTA